MQHTRHADPQHEARFLRLPQQQTGQSQRKTGDRAGIARFTTMDLGQRRPNEPAAEQPVETADADGQARGLPFAFRSRRHFKALRQRTFNSRNFPAQGKNGVPRYGAIRHGGRSLLFVPVMFL